LFKKVNIFTISERNVTISENADTQTTQRAWTFKNKKNPVIAILDSVTLFWV